MTHLYRVFLGLQLRILHWHKNLKLAWLRKRRLYDIRMPMRYSLYSTMEAVVIE